MFGMHVKITARPGQGIALASLLVDAAEAMPQDGPCRLYLVSRSPEDEDTVWVTEVWTDRESHAASLQDDATKEVMANAMPMIADVAEATELRTVGGKGL